MAVTSKMFFTLSDAWKVQSIDSINNKTCKEKAFCHFLVWHNHIVLNRPWLSSYYLAIFLSEFPGRLSILSWCKISIRTSLRLTPDWLCTTHNNSKRGWLISTKRYIKMYITTLASEQLLWYIWRTLTWWSSLGLGLNLFDILLWEMLTVGETFSMSEAANVADLCPHKSSW